MNKNIGIFILAYFLQYCIYENSIKGFMDDCAPGNTDILITKIKSNMKIKIGRGVAPSEEKSWRTTLVKISNFFKDIKESKNQYILLEFKVPNTFKRIDVIVIGSDGKKKTLLTTNLYFDSTTPKSLEIESKYRIVAYPNREAYEYYYCYRRG